MQNISSNSDVLEIFHKWKSVNFDLINILEGASKRSVGIFNYYFYSIGQKMTKLVLVKKKRGKRERTIFSR